MGASRGRRQPRAGRRRPLPRQQRGLRRDRQRLQRPHRVSPERHPEPGRRHRGKIGPDLTGSNRANLDYILLNSVDPSYDVPDGYKMVLILTVDGRLISGVVAEEDGTRVILKTVEQPEVIIAKEDIETRSVSPKSMMPDGQLEQMKPHEMIDLIKYLRTTEQVEMAQ